MGELGSFSEEIGDEKQGCKTVENPSRAAVGSGHLLGDKNENMSLNLLALFVSP